MKIRNKITILIIINKFITNKKGNEGVYRSIRLDNTGTYLSRNTGFTWEKIRDGVNKYAWGDHGGLFLLATVENATNQISFAFLLFILIIEEIINDSNKLNK